MKKEKEVTKDLAPGTAAPVDSSVGEAFAAALEEVITDVYVSWNDQQLALILAAGLEPAQVRQELGLALVGKEKAITLGEAISRATAKLSA